MKNFFANLKTKRGKSLDTTRLVLKDGRRLKPMVEELQSFISNGKKKSEIREKTRQVIADCQSQTDAIKGSSELKIPQEMELADGENAINCAVCDVSCYFAPEENEEPNCHTCNCGKEVHFGRKTLKCTKCAPQVICIRFFTPPESIVKAERRPFFSEKIEKTLKIFQIIEKIKKERISNRLLLV